MRRGVREGRVPGRVAYVRVGRRREGLRSRDDGAHVRKSDDGIAHDIRADDVAADDRRPDGDVRADGVAIRIGALTDSTLHARALSSSPLHVLERCHSCRPTTRHRLE